MVTTIYNMFGYFIEKCFPEIKNFELYNNDPFNETNAVPKEYPAIMLEIVPIPIDQLLNNIQEMVIDVKVHVISHVITSTKWDDTEKQSTANYLNLLDKVYRYLNLISSIDVPADLVNGDICISSIVRTNLEVAKQIGHLKDSIITFRCKVFDKTAQKIVQTLTINDIITDVEIDKTL